jgi:hypothetical protein
MAVKASEVIAMFRLLYGLVALALLAATMVALNVAPGFAGCGTQGC